MGGGTGALTYNVESTAEGTSLEVDAPNYTTNTFNISPTAQNLDTIRGDVTFGGSNLSIGALNIYDQANPVASTYAINFVNGISRTGSATIHLYGSSGGDNAGGGFYWRMR